MCDSRFRRESAPILVVIMVVIMIPVAMPPIPILFLLLRRQAIIVSVLAMRFYHPLVVIDALVVIPVVIVGIVRIVNAHNVVLAATDGRQRSK